MKKQGLKTFMLKSEDNSYIFVEGKNHPLYEPLYNVYYNGRKKPAVFSIESFDDTYNEHQKVSLKHFLETGILNLTAVGTESIKTKETYDIFKDTLKEIKKSPKKYPKFKNMKKHFIRAVDLYNEITELMPKEPEISYIEEYNSLNGRQSIEKISHQVISEPKKAVKYIENKNVDIKGRQRIKKYE